jgi:hypothetical protein
LLCGPSWPVDKINIWIFTHVPGMLLFRDVTKWMSLLIISYATIIALGIARGLAFIRLKRTSRALRLWAPLVTVAIAACYAFMMNDAYNVTHYRVFYTYHMHPDVVALEQYLQSRPGHARSLIFPRDIEPMRTVASHPYVEGLQIENSSGPDGLRHLNLEWDSLYGLFSSPMAPELLREMNIKYVVVPYDYDKVIYQGAISNWTFYDALQFIQSRRWLAFDRKIGRNYVFRIRGTMSAKAFIAPAPFVMNGGGATLAALVGTPLFNDRTALLMPDQALGRIWERIPNYVGGAWPVDTNLHTPAEAAKDVSTGAALAQAAASGHFAFTAAAESTASVVPDLYSGDGPLLFDSRFSVPRAGPIAFSANLDDVSNLNKTMLETTAFEQRRATFGYRGDDILFAPTPTQHATVNSVASDGKSGLVVLDDTMGAGVIADLDLSQLTVPGGYTASAGGVTARCRNDCILHAVDWEPGAKTIALRFNLSKAQATALLGTTFDVQLTIRRPLDLPASNVRTLLSHVTIPLVLRPYVDFRYNKLPPNTRATIYFRLRSRDDGSIVWYADDLQPSGEYTQQLQYYVSDALHASFERLLARHSSDYAWLAKYRLVDEPDGAGLYDITAIAVRSNATIVPKRIVFLQTPSWPQLASEDARQPRRVRVPVSLAFAFGSGVRATPLKPLPGYIAYALDPQRVNKRSATFVARIPAAPNSILDFAFYQPAGYILKLALRGPTGPAFSDVLTPPNGSSYSYGSTTVIDATAEAWPIGPPHCVPESCTGAATPALWNGNWKHFQLDTSPLGLSNRPITVIFELDQISGQNPSDSHFAISSRDGEAAMAHGIVPATLLDDEPLHFSRERTIEELGYRVVGGTLTLSNRSSHRIATVPVYPLRPLSLAIMQGNLRTFPSTSIQNGQRVTPEEYVGDISSPRGLLVFDEAWDPDWTLAVVPADFKPSGSALVDFMRTRRFALPTTDHYRVNDIFNGWWLPKGNLHVFMLMRLQAFSELAAIIWIVVSLLWLAIIIPFGRKWDTQH